MATQYTIEAEFDNLLQHGERHPFQLPGIPQKPDKDPESKWTFELLRAIAGQNGLITGLFDYRNSLVIPSSETREDFTVLHGRNDGDYEHYELVVTPDLYYARLAAFGQFAGRHSEDYRTLSAARKHYLPEKDPITKNDLDRDSVWVDHHLLSNKDGNPYSNLWESWRYFRYRLNSVVGVEAILVPEAVYKYEHRPPAWHRLLPQALHNSPE